MTLVITRVESEKRPWSLLPALALVAVLTLAGTASAQPGDQGETMIPAEGIVAAEVDSVTGPIPTLPEAEKLNLWSTGASPAGAVLMSPLFPGWGQLYTEGSWRSALAFGSQMWFWSRMLTRDRRAVRARQFAETFETGSVNYSGYNRIAEEDWEQMRDFAWWSGAALFIIALDAYVGAHLFHFDEDPIPVPNRWDEIFDRPGGDMPGSWEAPSIVVMQWTHRF